MNSRKILFLVPAYNEALSLPSLLTDLKAYAVELDASVLVVDDGSTDNTDLIAKNSGVLIISLPINLGIGGAVQTGLKFAIRNGFTQVIRLDGDGQHPPAEIKQLLTSLDQGADLVIGSRYIAHSRRNGNVSTLPRLAGSTIICWLIHLLSGVRVTDPTSGFTAFSEKMIAHFADDYPYDFPEPIALFSALRDGYKVVETPVRMIPRMSGNSSISSLRSLFYMMKVSWSLLLHKIFRGKNV